MNIKNVLFWLATITLAFFVGYFSNDSKHVDINNMVPRTLNQAQTNKTAPNKSKVVLLNKTNEIVKDETTLVLDNETIMKEVKQLLGTSSFMMDVSSIAKSYALIQNFSEQEVSNALSELEGSMNNNKNAMVVNLLIGRYSEINPYGAIDFIESNMKSSIVKNQSLSSAIVSWSKSDPNSAYEWVKENDKDKEQNGFMSSYKYAAIFNGLAKQDIDDAFIKLNEMANKGQSTNMAAMGIAETLEQSDEFTTFYENSKNLNSDHIMTTAITSWVKKDPQVVTDWLNRVEAGKDKTDMKNNVLENWIHTEPTAAADWYMNESNTDNRQTSVNRVVRNWGPKEPKQALEWLNQQSDIDNEMTTNSLLQSSVYSNTQFAMDNLSLLSNEDNKQSISQKIYHTLKRKNKEQAESFLNESTYKEFILKEIQTRKKRRKG